MDKRKLSLFTALFYPLAMALVAAGFLAFIMLLLKVDTLVVGSTVLWFYFINAALVFSLSRRTLKLLGFYNIFLALVMAVGALALLSLVVFLLSS